MAISNINVDYIYGCVVVCLLCVDYIVLYEMNHSRLATYMSPQINQRSSNCTKTVLLCIAMYNLGLLDRL